MDRKEAQIAKLPLFSSCRAKDIRWVAAVADALDVRPGTVLAHEGRSVREFMVVVEGELVATDAQGQKTVLGPGDYFGHDGLVNDLPHVKTLETLTPARVLVFEARAFRGLLDTLTSVGRDLMRDLVTELRELDRRIALPAQSRRSLRAVS